jgi:hypothetical protein
MIENQKRAQENKREIYTTPKCQDNFFKNLIP